MAESLIRELIELSDRLAIVEDAVKKARIIQQDVADEYFGKRDLFSNAATKNSIVCDYERYSLLSDVVQDYLITIADHVAEIHAQISQEQQRQKQND